MSSPLQLLRKRATQGPNLKQPNLAHLALLRAKGGTEGREGSWGGITSTKSPRLESAPHSVPGGQARMPTALEIPFRRSTQQAKTGEPNPATSSPFGGGESALADLGEDSGSVNRIAIPLR